ncbi:hypothetical protein CH251_17355 [Rhodococcus sp. 06-462-5]|nr:hypothetical protein CH251_17355 [Rhodococcus sp. 06-462-5]
MENDSDGTGFLVLDPRFTGTGTNNTAYCTSSRVRHHDFCAAGNPNASMVGGVAANPAARLSVVGDRRSAIRTTPTQHCRLDVGIESPVSSLQR